MNYVCVRERESVCVCVMFETDCKRGYEASRFTKYTWFIMVHLPTDQALNTTVALLSCASFCSSIPGRVSWEPWSQLSTFLCTACTA